MLELKRVQVDKFKIEEAITFEELEKRKENVQDILIKMEDVFTNFQTIKLPLKKKELLLNGVKLKGYENLKDGVYNIYIENSYIGLGIVKAGTLKRDIIL